MTYHLNDIFESASVVAKERNVFFYFVNDVLTEQEFKENVRFLVDGEWAVPDWNLEQPFTWEDVEAKLEETTIKRGKEMCKQKARKLLAESDWSVTPDVQNSLENPNDWLNYREIVRRLFLNPIPNPSFPVLPEVRWTI